MIITLNIPQPNIEEICQRFHYQERVPDPQNPDVEINNPESKQAFVKRMTVELLIKEVAEVRRTLAMEQAVEKARRETQIT